MLHTPDAPKIPWQALKAAFQDFEPDPEWLRFPAQAFQASLIQPAPPFVQHWLEARAAKDPDRHSAVRALYAFLLEQRYTRKLNLLYFAFDLFEETTALPEEVIARTPYPHEDGVPAFRYAACGTIRQGGGS
ncbi:MAG: hypothetical protein WHS86_07500 [Desulfosoma sp.]